MDERMQAHFASMPTRYDELRSPSSWARRTRRVDYLLELLLVRGDVPER